MQSLMVFLIQVQLDLSEWHECPRWQSSLKYLKLQGCEHNIECKWNDKLKAITSENRSIDMKFELCMKVINIKNILKSAHYRRIQQNKNKSAHCLPAQIFFYPELSSKLDISKIQWK